ncbi:GNAT family N-acetyltransferase [Streptomyces sp. WMMB 322]|uniref:GNAT family N-acetyltransferase n=1 Tax=Streptomyces sp. WMMB 322 TaxID=1286821 RepID=UPI0006E1212A|nr:GNAT family N-acetyltransferase [Streptomyces sp. WMMB 322]
MRIRAGAERDLRRLQRIECAAGGLFRALGMDRIADDAPPPLPVLRRYAHSGGLWVAVDGDGEAPAHEDEPVAYAMTEPVDGSVHIEQISVDPARAHRRIGRALIEHAARRAQEAGVPALTLCTFAEVPWNAPYYERCGFRVLAGDELTPGLRRIRAEEARAGLDRWPRVCMRRELGAG